MAAFGAVTDVEFEGLGERGGECDCAALTVSFHHGLVVLQCAREKGTVVGTLALRRYDSRQGTVNGSS